MKFGIIGAMESEVAILKETLSNRSVVVHHGIEFYVGQIAELDVVIVQSGIGKVNATISATLLVEHFNVTQIINTGTAGGIDPALEVGDIVIANSLIHHDVDVRAFGYEYGQMAGMPVKYYPDTKLMRLAQNAVRSLDIEPILGLILSGDEFVHKDTRISEIRKYFVHARATDMESAAIAQAAHVLGVPFVIIRAISDGADDNATMTYDQFVQIASDISAKMTIKMLEEVSQEMETK